MRIPVIALVAISCIATAQEQHGETMHHDAGMKGMFGPYAMTREASGTSWQPDSTPMDGVHSMSGDWMTMVHGNLALVYDHQGGPRGGRKTFAESMLMGMAQRPVAGGTLGLRAMLSLDPAMGKGGYPLLFQTGESWNGKPLVDRQHPHDLFSELSVAYSYALSKKSDISFYLGYPGEPALGSVAFMHRPSALAMPDAPLSHHWNDGTHITFGVATIGYRYDKFKIEASSFTGREPDENRYNFDKPRFDSWSGRLSFNPTKNWALQVSHGFIKSPEMLHPTENVHRTTASATVSYPFGKEHFFNGTVLWGLNKTSGHDGENAVLAEATLRLVKFALYTRYEWVQKSTEELALDEAVFAEHEVFPVNEWTLGLTYDLVELAKTRLALGAHATWFHGAERLWGLYGRNPVGAEFFLRIYPALMKMKM